MYKIKGNGVLRILIILSSMSAPFIGAYSWILLMGRSGVVTTFLKDTFNIQGINIYGFAGILVVLTLQLYPLVFLYVSGALKNIDQSLMEASLNLGCSGVKRFFSLIIPLVMPTILASSLLVFMRALASCRRRSSPARSPSKRPADAELSGRGMPLPELEKAAEWCGGAQ